MLLWGLYGRRAGKIWPPIVHGFWPGRSLFLDWLVCLFWRSAFSLLSFFCCIVLLEQPHVLACLSTPRCREGLDFWQCRFDLLVHMRTIPRPGRGIGVPKRRFPLPPQSVLDPLLAFCQCVEGQGRVGRNIILLGRGGTMYRRIYGAHERRRALLDAIQFHAGIVEPAGVEVRLKEILVDLHG